jgi:NTP pyrophosphatase (non-canonical NTP hydrolase)
LIGDQVDGINQVNLDEERTVQKLKDAIEHFCSLRDWQQFHDAKSLSMAVATEAAELMEHFRWLTPNEIEPYMVSVKRGEVEYELADIFWMLLCFCNRYNIDLSAALERKLEHNVTRYPVEKAKGNHTKYTEL